MKSDDYNTLWIVQCQTNKTKKKERKKEKKKKMLLARCQKSELDVHKSKSMVPSEVSVFFFSFFMTQKNYVSVLPLYEGKQTKSTQ